jgi:uncharacterized Zn-binding protein involved in type VI secretion
LVTGYRKHDKLLLYSHLNIAFLNDLNNKTFAGKGNEKKDNLNRILLIFRKQKFFIMSGPAARTGDMHVCPMSTPGTPPIPHVGGPITGPGCPTVLIGGMPAAVAGDICVCVGPPDTIAMGSTTVLIGNKPSARMGDQTAHGGAIMAGLPTVLIGG